MGASCSQPAIDTVKPAQEILVMVDHINIVSGHSTAEMRLLRVTLARNSRILKKRIANYELKLKGADEAEPVTAVWRAEKGRTEELLKKIQQMQAPLAYIA